MTMRESRSFLWRQSWETRSTWHLVYLSRRQGITSYKNAETLKYSLNPTVLNKSGNAQIMQLLLASTPPDSGVAAHCLCQPAWKASAEGHDDIVQMLLKAGADKNWANRVLSFLQDMWP